MISKDELSLITSIINHHQENAKIDELIFDDHPEPTVSDDSKIPNISQISNVIKRYTTKGTHAYFKWTWAQQQEINENKSTTWPNIAFVNSTIHLKNSNDEFHEFFVEEILRCQFKLDNDQFVAFLLNPNALLNFNMTINHYFSSRGEALEMYAELLLIKDIHAFLHQFQHLLENFPFANQYLLQHLIFLSIKVAAIHSPLIFVLSLLPNEKIKHLTQQNLQLYFGSTATLRRIQTLWAYCPQLFSWPELNINYLLQYPLVEQNLKLIIKYFPTLIDKNYLKELYTVLCSNKIKTNCIWVSELIKRGYFKNVDINSLYLLINSSYLIENLKKFAGLNHEEFVENWKKTQASYLDGIQFIKAITAPLANRENIMITNDTLFNLMTNGNDSDQKISLLQNEQEQIITDDTVFAKPPKLTPSALSIFATRPSSTSISQTTVDRETPRTDIIIHSAVESNSCRDDSNVEFSIQDAINSWNPG